MTIATTERWSRQHWLALTVVLLAGSAIRVVLLPTEGLRGDLDQFVGWVHHIATEGLGSLYGGTDAGPVSFGPVMAYVWWLLAAIQPAFVTTIDSADPGIRMLMKVPASAADLGLALVAVFALRGRARWAILAAAAIVLHPAVIYVSAWWGQYESIFVLWGLAAVVAAARGRNGVAAALVALALMTKPQAVAFIVPFAAWFWATGGPREVARAALIGLAVMVLLWLPFLARGGPLDYVRGLGRYQAETFNVLSLRAWNPWWIVQEAAAGGAFIRDDVAFLGPVTLRYVGYIAAGALSAVIAWAILRDPRPRTLTLGLVASVLVVFTFMTQIHERYAYAALVLLVVCLPERRARWLFVGLSVAFTLNLVAAIPPSPEVAEILPVGGILGIVGSLAMLTSTIAALHMAARPADRSADLEPPPPLPA